MTAAEVLLKVKTEEDATTKFKLIKNSINSTEEELRQLQRIAEGIDLNPKISAEEAKQKIKALRADVRDLKAEEKALKDEQEALNKAIKDSGKAAKDSSDRYQQLASSISSISSIAQTASIALGAVGGAGVLIGKSLLESASQAETFSTALDTAFQGDTAGADKLLGQLKEIANVTPFVTSEVIEAGIKLKAYGETADEIPAVLTRIGDMASGMGKSLNQATEAYNDAQTGELERLKEFGITKAMIDQQVNGALSETKDKTEQVKLIMQGLNEIMVERFAGGMEKASKTLSGEISTLQGEFEDLKSQLGQELLPTVKSTVEGLTEIVRAIKEVDPETKKAGLAVGGLVTGLALAGSALAGIVAIGASTVASLVSIVSAVAANTLALGALTAATGLWVAVMTTAASVLGSFLMAFLTGPGIIIAAGVAIKEITERTIAWQKATADLKIKDLTESTQRHAEALQEVKKVLPDITNGEQAFNEIKKQGIDILLEEEAGRQKVLSVLKLLSEEQMSLTATRAEEKKVLDELVAAGARPEEIKQQELIIANIDKQISETRAYKDEINNATKSVQSQKQEMQGVTDEIQKQNQALTEQSYIKHNPEIIPPEEKKAFLDYVADREAAIAEENRLYDEKIAKQKEAEAQVTQSYSDESIKRKVIVKETADYEVQTQYESIENIKRGRELLAEYQGLQSEGTGALQEQLLILQQQKSELRAEAEEYLSLIAKGEQLGSTALDIVDTYVKTNKEIDETNKKLAEKNSLISEEKIRLEENYRKYLEIRVLNDEITQAEADRMLSNFLGQQNEVLREQVDLIMQQIDLYGAGSLSDEQQKILDKYIQQKNEIKSINNELKDTSNETNNVSNNMRKISDDTKNAKDTMTDYKKEVKDTSNEIRSMSNELQKIGNISAMQTDNKTGNFMSVQDALTNTLKNDAFTGENLRPGATADYTGAYYEEQEKKQKEADSYSGAYAMTNSVGFVDENMNYLGHSDYTSANLGTAIQPASFSTTHPVTNNSNTSSNVTNNDNSNITINIDGTRLSNSPDIQQSTESFLNSVIWDY